MTAKATIPDTVYLIERINEKGLRERIQYVGKPRDKPKGWRVVRYLGRQT